MVSAYLLPSMMVKLIPQFEQTKPNLELRRQPRSLGRLPRLSELKRQNPFCDFHDLLLDLD